MEMNSTKDKIYVLASQVAEDEGLELISADLLGSGRRLLLLPELITKVQRHLTAAPGNW